MAPTRATYRKLHKRPLGWKTNPKIHCNVPTTRNMKIVNKLIKMVRFKITLRLTPVTLQMSRYIKTLGIIRPMVVEIKGP